jgi:diguanylate cyclase (GGDEF)-like protein
MIPFSNQTEAPLILIVDDDPVMRMQLRLFLQKEGYQIAEAEDGNTGFAAYNILHPDMVLVDVVMPEMNGFECCLGLRNLPGGDRSPILMITGLDDRDSVDQAFASGATDYVTKPIHWAVLRQRVRRLIHQAYLQQQLEAANHALQHLVSIDGLTQVANRRRFDEYLDQEWRRTSREMFGSLEAIAIPISLLLCDVDCFKLYNDTYGHQAGDRCLQRVVKAISSMVKRPADLVARYGGEEFAVILPNTTREGATYLAEQICLNVKSLAIPHISSHVSNVVTLSIGIATIVPHADLSLETLIVAADAALYEAKKAGRDTYCVSQLNTPVASAKSTTQ